MIAVSLCICIHTGIYNRVRISLNLFFIVYLYTLCFYISHRRIPRKRYLTLVIGGHRSRHMSCDRYAAGADEQYSAHSA